MALDEAAARALVAELGEAFVAGLRGLVEAAAAELGARGRALAAEARELAARRRRLEEERGRLEEERGALERERGRPARPPGDGGAGDEAVSLNLGGEARVTVLRSTLTQCEGSMLAAAFSGRWELPKDDLGGVFVNFEPALFLPLVQHLRMRQIEAPDDPTPPPSFDLREQEACFRRMLRYYNLEDWVYRSPLPEEIPYQVHIDDHTYAVLPPQDPEETVAFGDMSSQTVAVPRGWEILQTDAEEFECIITDLASHGWGALRLCCQNPGGGFSSYLTRLHGGGTAGTRWSGDARLIQSVGAPDGRQYRFSPACSARLVIRVRDRPLGGAMSRGEGRRLAAI